MTRTPATGSASEDLRLARLHLRLGMLDAARAELEDLGRRDALDAAGLVDLAEARWRAGDLAEADAAARSHLAAGGHEPVAIVVAAEAAAISGRQAEALALVRDAGLVDAAALERLFAGMPRRASWPAAATPSVDAVGASASDLAPEAPAGARAPDAGAAVSAPTGRPSGPPTWVEPARPKGHADPQAELSRARAELAEVPERGLLRLALVLRLDPTLAAEVLQLVRLRREPAALLLRGDAQRLLGRHLEAEAEFADAAEVMERDAIAHARRAARPATGEDR